MSTHPKQLGKYNLLERLGHGGAAEVWKALDTQLQRYVALKLLRPDLREDHNFIARFRREAQLIASLHHPNIVKIHDFQVYQPSETEQEESTPIAYMVMDYVEGHTLADYIINTAGIGQFPPPGEVVGLFTQIALAVDYAHQKGMIHRDIKPANILLDRRNTTHVEAGEPILTDFGVAKMLSASSNTQSGTLLGTPFYISPEQARGNPGNERSDIYSLGVILYETLTGMPPFRGETAVEVISQHVNAMPVPPTQINPAIPPALTQVIMRCLAKDPASRFASAAAMAAAIAAAYRLPIPESLGQQTLASDVEDMPTLLTPLNQRQGPISQPGIMPTPALTPQQTPAGPVSQPGFSGPISQSGLAGNAGPISQSGISGQSGQSSQSNQSGVMGQSGQSSQPNYTPVIVPPTPAAPVGSPPPAAPPVSPERKQPRTGLYLAITGVLLFVLIAGGLGAFFLLPTLTPQTAIKPVTGRAFYVSSGQLRPDSAQGIADGLQVNMQNVPNPQAGNSYYLWLLGDKRPEPGPDLLGGIETRPVKPPLLLSNNLPVRAGAINFFYRGDGQHNNLISATSRLLITEGPGGNTPTAPPTNRSTWRYYAEIPQQQIADAGEGFSALVHIRHLFYNETNIEALGLPGGLDIWLFRNTEKILEFTSSARDNWQGQNTTNTNQGLMRDHFIRVIDFLDGSANRHVDVPPGTPLLGDPAVVKVALITVNPELQNKELATNPPGYVDHVQLHVGQVAKAPDVTPEMRQQAAEIVESVNRAKTWLLNVRKNIQQLLKIMNNLEQLRQPSTGALLDDTVNQAMFAYIGQMNPETNRVEGGVLQAHYVIQQLASYTITDKLPQSL